MSGGKGNGVAHQVIDQVTKVAARQDGKIAELIKKHNDLAAAIAAQEQVIKQMAGFTASEMGKFQGETAKHVSILARSVDGIDLNVLALAEMAKEIIGQLTQIDTVFKNLHARTRTILANSHAALSDDGQVRQLTAEDLTAFNKALELSEEEIAKVRSDATDWYKNLVSSAFKTVQEKRAQAEKEALEAEAKAKAEVEAATAKAEEEKKESEVVNAELKAAAEAERTIVTNKSGGPGAAFPEGADIFGG